MWLASIVAVILVLPVVLVRPNALPAAAPILAAWFLSPVVAFWVSRPQREAEPVLTAQDRRQLHRLARKTWNFFETFVSEEEHWLPPDNYQEDPKGEVAHRTSPTNIGLYLLSSLAAHDFGYLSLPELLDRLDKTLATLERLERFHGHFYNWYDTASLQPLHPAYISTVDSGNLLGCLLALQRGLKEQVKQPVPNPAGRGGLADVLALVARAFRGLELPDAGTQPEVVRNLDKLLQELERLLSPEPAADAGTTPAAGSPPDHLSRSPFGDLFSYDEWLQHLDAKVNDLAEQIRTFAALLHEPPEELQHWTECFVNQLASGRAELARLAPWLPVLRGSPAEFAVAGSEPPRPKKGTVPRRAPPPVGSHCTASSSAQYGSSACQPRHSVPWMNWWLWKTPGRRTRGGNGWRPWRRPCVSRRPGSFTTGVAVWPAAPRR